MEKVLKNKRFGYFAIFGFLFIFLISVNCNLAEMLVDQSHMDSTNTAWARETEWSATHTEYARQYNYKTATARQATANSFDATRTVAWAVSETQSESIRQTELAPKPPIITGINFPKEIPGNGSTTIGLLYFKDLDGDISHINYDVVRSTSFGGGVDNSPKLNSGTWTDGSIKIYLWCDGQQVVTLEATIIDMASNRSNTMSFTFTCK